jgi:hypothetical protein
MNMRNHVKCINVSLNEGYVCPNQMDAYFALILGFLDSCNIDGYLIIQEEAELLLQ